MPEDLSPAPHLLYKWSWTLITVEEMIAGINSEGFPGSSITYRCRKCITRYLILFAGKLPYVKQERARGDEVEKWSNQRINQSLRFSLPNPRPPYVECANLKTWSVVKWFWIKDGESITQNARSATKWRYSKSARTRASKMGWRSCYQ
jgi:hypothetical protein